MVEFSSSPGRHNMTAAVALGLLAEVVSLAVFCTTASAVSDCVDQPL